MADPENETETRFAAVVEAFAKTPRVTHSRPGSRLFGSSSLKVHDTIFAMITSSGQYVVKLPRARVEALAATDAGERFDGNRGRPMKEWLVVRSESAEVWLGLAREALEFVGT